MEIYLDNGASTQVDPKAAKAMLPFFTEKYANISSTHSFGKRCSYAVDDARKIIADSIGANPEEIIFTSGGTESDNFAVKGIAFANKGRGNHIITTKIEHKAVLKSCEWLEKQGFKVTYLDVDEEGFVDPKALEKAITKKTILVSIIHGNNEIGTIQDLMALGNICKKYDIYFHTDACQSYTKTLLDVKKQPVGLMTLNSHKIHGPKGIGALYIRKGTKIEPWQHGGGHEFGMRSGTEDVPGIVGFAEAVRLGLNGRDKHIKQMIRLRNKLIEGILENVADARLNGPKYDTDGSKRLCSNTNLSFKGLEADEIGGCLDAKRIYSSAGSACSARSHEPSYVLKAVNVPEDYIRGSLRLTLSRFTTEKEIGYVLETLPGIVEKMRKVSFIGKIIGKL